jgi:hypothetical protein
MTGLAAVRVIRCPPGGTSTSTFPLLCGGSSPNLHRMISIVIANRAKAPARAGLAAHAICHGRPVEVGVLQLPSWDDHPWSPRFCQRLKHA